MARQSRVIYDAVNVDVSVGDSGRVRILAIVVKKPAEVVRMTHDYIPSSTTEVAALEALLPWKVKPILEERRE
jgi:hypothetical protein